MERIQRIFNSFKVKLTRSNRVSPVLVDFSEFFGGDRILQLLGCPYLSRDIRKSRQIHFIASQIVTFVISSLIFVELVIAKDTNIFISIESVFQCTELLVSIFDSFLLLIWKHEKIAKVLELLDSNFPHHGLDQINFETRKYLKSLNVYEWLIKLLYFMVFAQFISMPFIWLLYKFIIGEPLEWVVLFNIYLPFDQMKSGVYEVIFCVEVWSLVLGLFAFMSTDLTFCSLVHVLSMEFDNLAESIAEIDPESNEKEAIKDLKKCIETHQKLLEAVGDIDNIFSILLLIDILGMIVILCLVSYICLSYTTSFLLIKLCLVVPAVILHVFVLCSSAERLNRASNRIADSAYNTPWYEGNLQYRKLVLLIMMRANEGGALTAWKFMKVNMETYGWVLNQAYSYYSFLKSI